MSKEETKKAVQEAVPAETANVITEENEEVTEGLTATPEFVSASGKPLERVGTIMKN